MTRAAIYTRISNDPEGRALGVRRQEQDSRELAERRGWKLAGVYTDNDVTASGRKRRPDWERLMRDVREGKVDAVVAYSSSRMYRNLRDLGELIELADSGKVQVATVASGEVNLATADGRMIARILASVDAGEVERVRERVNRKRKELVSAGMWLGGYRPFGFEIRDGKLVPNDKEAKLIRAAASDLLSGQTIASVARRWNAKGITTTGGKPWTKSHVRTVLTAERNAQGVLTPTDLRRVQELIDGRKTGRKPDRYLLTGLLLCGRCGARMTGRGGRYICTATGPLHLSTVARALDEHVFRAAGERENEQQPKRVDVHDPSEPLVRQREAKVREQEQLGESDLSAAAIRGRDRKLQREIDEIDRQLEATRSESFYGRLWKDTEDWDERAWLEAFVESVTLRPAAKAGLPRFDPSRVQITWRA